MSRKWLKTQSCDRKLLGFVTGFVHYLLDRHVTEHGDRTAIIWAGDEPGTYRHISYRELKDEVCRLANVLKHLGVTE